MITSVFGTDAADGNPEDLDDVYSQTQLDYFYYCESKFLVIFETVCFCFQTGQQT